MRPCAAIALPARNPLQRRAAVKPRRAAGRWLAPLGLAAGLAVASMTASASYVYTYISNNFSAVTGTGLSTSDHVVFEFETASVLPSGTSYLTPLAWQFAAGAVSFGSGDAGATLAFNNLGSIYLVLDNLGLSSICTFGQLAGQGAFTLNNGRSPNSMITGTACASQVDNFDSVSLSQPSASTGFTRGYSSFTVREVVQQPSNGLPEPASLALAALAMLAAGAGRRTGWRRR